MNSTDLLPLDSEQATLALAGGKGLNLAHLIRAGFTVPAGFLVTTAAYRRFVTDNGLQEVILAALETAVVDDPQQLQAASQKIRGTFAQGTLPSHLVESLAEAYNALSEEPQAAVAVRSSATAEDLPDMSFAGQQDTFLQVIGEAALRQAVIDCWSSLWTARAISYRARNGIDHSDVALAVIVQLMVSSEVSGVLFTANPLNGRRTEMVIDATFGLGEALVSGQVEPDQYVVRSTTREIVQKRLGSKAVTIQGKAGGGTETVSGNGRERQALADAQILELADLGSKIADLYDFPQDIEWGWAGQAWHVLQSRPITSLFPVPEPLSADPLQVTFSFAAVQGMLDPITPFGQDMLRGLMAGLSTKFGIPHTMVSQRVVFEAGERLWINITPLLRHPIGRKLAKSILGVLEPGSARAIEALWDDPRLQPQPGWFRLRTFTKIARFFGPLFLQLPRVLRHPEQRRARFQQYLEIVITDFAQRSRRADTLSARLDLALEIMERGFARMLPEFLPVIAGGMSTLNLLTKLANSIGHDALTLTRGLPHNVTTEMDLALWHVAETVQQDAVAAALFAEKEASELAELYLAAKLPAVTATAVADFMERYGMRGVGEIDFGRPRWRQDPTPVMQTLQSYMQIPTEHSPQTHFSAGAAAVAPALVELGNALHQTRGGRLKARLARFATQRMRTLAGTRESPKFTMIQLFGIARRGLQDSGQQLVATGVLARSDDIFFLQYAELRALAQVIDSGRPASSWRNADGLTPAALVQSRQADALRESRRRQLPRILLSDGQAFYEGVAETAVAGDLTGSPVSPGIATGPVRVVFDPHQTRLDPGDILVCLGTDPAWTPLFLAAGGLIMEVGGMMTHGSVVAREYGIPAVVGVSQATERLQTGQLVRVDGSTGAITILPESESG